MSNYLRQPAGNAARNARNTKWITASVARKNAKKGEAGQHVRVWVRDNGIGIPAAHQKVIFGVFQKLHSYDSYPGTGIGLALVKKGVERIGGRVGVESAPDKGSRFLIELMKPDILKQINSV